MYSMRNHDKALESPLDPHPVDSDIFGSRRAIVPFGAMDKVQQQHDEENTQASGSWSGLSDLSAEATDEFGRRLLQHHRDEKRLRDANRQPFRKARPRPRIAEAILREERERDSAKHERAGSSDSNPSENIPITLPREWGRKATRQKHWMRNILQEPEADESAIYSYKSAFTGDEDWRVDSSLHHMNTTLPPRSPEVDDFTSASLLASTPAPASSRPLRKIDELTRRELEDIEREGHANRILDEIGQRSPNGTLRRSSSSRLRERAAADAMDSSPPKLSRPPPVPNASSPSPPSRIPRRPRSALGNDATTNGRVKSPSPTKAKPSDSPRTKHNRNDSMNLLRKLARVSSMSPSPARTELKPEVKDTNSIEAPKVEEKLTPRKSSGWGAEFETLAKTESKPAEEPKNSAEANDAEPPQSEQPQQQPHAKSALEDIMREQNQYGESTIQSLEDIAHPNVEPTITLDLEEATATTAKETKKEEFIVGDGLTQEEKDRRQQDLAMEGLNKHLQAAQTSIKDASRGLRRVENRIEAAQEGHPAPAPIAVTATTAALPNVLKSIGFTHCEVCGGGYHSVWYALWAEFLSLFYNYDSKARFGISFTWLGTLCLGWLIWYTIESTLCSFYCTPRYAVPGTNFPPPGGDTPHYPFTIPMLIFHPWREYWEDWYDDVRLAVEAWFHEMTHEAQFVSTPTQPVTVRMPLSNTVSQVLTSETAIRVAKSLMDAVDEVGSMWDDEAW